MARPKKAEAPVKETKKKTVEPIAEAKATAKEQEAAKPKAKPEKAPVVASKPKAKEYRVNTLEKPKLNVRAGAGADYKIVGKIKNGATVAIVEQQNGFGKIKDGEWVNMAFLK